MAMEHKGGPAGVFPHKYKPSSIHINEQSQEISFSNTTVTMITATSTTTLQAPLTPRIDISRASSSSYHEDSSPENVFDQVGTGTLQESSGCLELFQEDVDELRSSTEELFFMEKERGQTECEKPSSTVQVSRAPMIFKFDDSQTLQQFNQYNRKDSGSSEVAAFLNPSGRTSRISSVGSQGSAVSRLSGFSRSPSPHKMIVETSFCGPKPIEPTTSDGGSVEQLTTEIENVILARRGDPTKVALAEGVDLKANGTSQFSQKSLITKLQESSMTPAEMAKAEAKEARRKEIEALKVRLNAINQRQLEKTKSGALKKVVGITPEGTEYIRIKLKPDHLYEDNGVSPNEKIVEENEFTDLSERKKKEKTEKNEEENSNQISHKSPTHAADRSPSPASGSVSRKSSFCSFFKSKDSWSDTTLTVAKLKTSTSAKSKLNEKSPNPSPSKNSLSSRIALSLFKTNRNTSPSQSPLESTAKEKAGKTQYQSRQPITLKDKPRLRYYDSPDIIHIPLHTPPEEKEFSALKKKHQKNVTKTIDSNETKIASITVHEEKKNSSPPLPSHFTKNQPKTAQIEKIQNIGELELQESSSNQKSTEEATSSLWSVEVQRHSSQESQETVISSQLKNDLSKNGLTEKTIVETTNEIHHSQSIQPTNSHQRGRHKKHILFSTKLGSGSEEHIFSTQLSLSKTESQSSQLSEQVSVFESPKNEEFETNIPEVTHDINLKHQSSNEVEKVTPKSVRSRSDHSDSESRPQSGNRKQNSSSRSSSEFSKKQESSEELLHKIPKENSKEPQYLQNIVKSNEQTVSMLHQKTSRMDISSESDEGRSDIEGCIHKRVSRLMEDHESTGLVLQESFDDELPYVPTTLPEEKSCGIKLIPTKERAQTELITFPVERPRSTTPINPTSLDNFCERKQSDSSDTSLVRGEKLRISLPRQKAEQSKEHIQQKTFTRRISNLSNKSWTEFAEQSLQNTSVVKKSERIRKESNSSQDGDQYHHSHQHQSQQQQQSSQIIMKSHSKKSLTSKWIDFENIPEKRQAPKKITTIPMNRDVPNEKIHNTKHSHYHHQRLHYVSPEECQCECHESKKDVEAKTSTAITEISSDDSQNILDENGERNSTVSTDSSLDCSFENDETNYLLQHTSSTILSPTQEDKAISKKIVNLDKPFGMDLSVELGGHSNRSSIISQDLALHK